MASYQPADPSPLVVSAPISTGQVVPSLLSPTSRIVLAERDRVALTELGMALGITERACCCPARPVVRVMMPATACRPDPVDLLLCGHHYRASQAALQAAGAAVYDHEGLLIMGTAGRRQPYRHQTAAAA